MDRERSRQLKSLIEWAGQIGALSFKEALSEERIDSRLAGTELDSVVLERGAGFVVNGGEDRGTVDEGDSRDCLVGDGQIPGRDCSVERRKGHFHKRWRIHGGHTKRSRKRRSSGRWGG